MTPDRADPGRLRRVEDGLLEQKAELRIMGESITALRGDLAEARGTLTSMIAPIGEAVMGDNKSPGLRERVRALEAARMNARWIMGVIVSAMTPLLIKFVLDFLKAPHPPGGTP